MQGPSKLQPLIQWHTKSTQSHIPKSRVLLKKEKNGSLKVIDTSDLSLKDRFLHLFGKADHSLKQILPVIQQNIEKQYPIPEDLQKAIKHLNEKIERHNTKHSHIPKLTFPDHPSSPHVEENVVSSSAKPPKQMVTAPKSHLIRKENLVQAPISIADQIALLYDYQFQNEDEQRLLEQTDDSEQAEYQIQKKQLEKEQENCDIIITGFSKIEKDFDFMAIEGDGHCLFRSIAAELIFLLPSETLREKITMAVQNGQLDQEKETSKQLSLANVFDSLEKIERFQAEGKTSTEITQKIMTNEKLSASWVHLLRMLATNRFDKNPDLKKELQGFITDRTVEEHLNKIQTMSFCEWGGESEIIEICRALAISICSVDLLLSGTRPKEEIAANIFTPQQMPSASHVARRLEECRADLYLVFQKNHYNALIPKRPRA